MADDIGLPRLRGRAPEMNGALQVIVTADYLSLRNDHFSNPLEP
jgi:hypothetical protein